MTTEELKEVLEKHKKWLNNEEGGERADLRNANLSGADLRHADLRHADLSHADLQNADLQNADLSHATLRNANLSGADLSNADLSNADLRHADLQNADLDYSVLPLWCGSLKTHFDDKQIIQLLYHVVKAGLNSQNTGDEIKAVLNTLKDTANKFHRVDECGKIEEL